ncbi:MAG: sigma-54-dependent Fis family transcriptional regulator [Tepidanaerobacteraceae bacterium]|jgi:transcriptional regulator with PAS, ATPase and Fis domain
MNKTLKDMQDTVMKYARVLSQILKVDVEIVDSDLNRIAGTGRFSSKINTNMAQEGSVYREVVRSGEAKVIDKPGEHALCLQCPKRDECEEKFEISTPIKLDDNVIGVLGLVCFDDTQKEHILENFETYPEVLEQFSDLIALKVKEEADRQNMLSLIGIMTNIVDKIEQGVIVFNDEGKIVNINSIAKNMLDIGEVCGGENVTLRATGNVIVDQDEYILEIHGKSFTLIGEHYKVIKKNLSFDNIFIFTEINKLRNRLLTMANVRESMQLENIMGESKAIKDLKQKVIKVASSSSTVLITGESGTGKELFARAIHSESPRKDRPFVTINCAAIPETLLESELFGYVKGAFTGADPKGKMGKIELANTGTLFLDEIGDMPLYLQSKLLRVLEQKEIVRLGSNNPIPVDVRIIAATNKNLEKMIEEKTFRDDLYYRLNVIPFVVPPLRHRKEDIRILVENFTGKYAGLFNKKVIGFENSVWKYLDKYDWPGNVRELENVVEYMVNMLDRKGIVTPKLLPLKIIEYGKNNEGIMTLEQMERQLIKKTLETYGNNLKGKQKSAEVLGIGIATLYRKVNKYGIQ